MSLLVVLDAGHGGKDSGAIGNGLKEKDLTIKIVNRIADKLKMYDVRVAKTRVGDETLSLQSRCNIANVLGADLFVSVHINAGGGTGYESFIHTSVKNDSETIRLQKGFHNQTLFKDRGMKSSNFQVLRGTQMTAILTENGFIDNVNDMNVLTKNIEAVADYHVYGILNYLGLKKKVNETYYIKTGTVNSIEVAEQVAKNIRKLGYLATIVKT